MNLWVIVKFLIDIGYLKFSFCNFWIRNIRKWRYWTFNLTNHIYNNLSCENFYYSIFYQCCEIVSATLKNIYHIGFPFQFNWRDGDDRFGLAYKLHLFNIDTRDIWIKAKWKYFFLCGFNNIGLIVTVKMWFRIDDGIWVYFIYIFK